jgi:UDP-2-acetamido-3-amino-2,3-dideoxy-glucuronate N-acetyltransferase
VERPDVEAVVLSTPSHLHAAMALQALAAGKHVFIEKPMALSLRDAEAIRASARVHHRTAFVGHILRYHPVLEHVSSLVHSGELGPLCSIQCFRFATGEPRGSEGPWWSLAPHDVSVMCHLFGESPLCVSSTIVSGRRSGSRRVNADLVFSGGRVGRVAVATDFSRRLRRLAVIGQRRTAVFDDTPAGAHLALHETRKEWIDEKDPDAFAPGRRPVRTPHDPLSAEIRSFLSTIRHGAPSPTDADEGCRVVAVLEAGERSVRSGGQLVDVISTPRDPPRPRAFAW